MHERMLGLRTVIHPVADLAAARAWWIGFLGVQPSFDAPFYVGFDVAGDELGLLPGADPADGAHVYWGVADVDAAVAEAVAHGAVVHQAPQDVGVGIITALVRLPDGSITGFIRNPNVDRFPSAGLEG